MFLELDTHYHHLDSRFLDESNNTVIPKILFLLLLNNDNKYL